jgi:hypothetical protein
VRASPLWFLLLLLATTLLACRSGKVKPGECTQMLDKYVDMTIAADPKLASLPPAQAAVVRDMKREVKKGEKSYRQVQEQCEAEVSRHEYDCAMAAPTPNDWEACIE